MKKTVTLLKSLGYAYLATILLVLIYNLLLTYTPLKTSSIPLATSLITTLGAACAGFYMSYKNASKGLLYGVLAGVFYVLIMMMIYFLVEDGFKFEMVTIYKSLLDIIAGGIGGIIGVNMK